MLEIVQEIIRLYAFCLEFLFASVASFYRVQCPYDFREYQAPVINRNSADVSTHVVFEIRSIGSGFPDGL